MVKIVTGKINDFKTTKALHLYLKDKQGDGFLSVKHMKDHLVISYDALRLSTQEKRKWIINQKNSTETFFKMMSYGPYLFNLDTKEWIEKSILEMILYDVSPIYLDEIGQLELNGFGYDQILKKLLINKRDLILVIREDLIEKVIRHYEIKAYEIIK
jgi:nucleoside-triphosphatase THEP1